VKLAIWSNDQLLFMYLDGILVSKSDDSRFGTVASDEDGPNRSPRRWGR
jgi:hypothetical protein